MRAIIIEPGRSDPTGEKGGVDMRTGYTTGTCAAAAAGAAAFFLCTGTKQPHASVLLPDGSELVLPIVWDSVEPLCCGVHKDAGDDPDVTGGTLICAQVMDLSEYRKEERALSCLTPLEQSHVYRDDAYPGLWLRGGRGIGTVTKKGLSCPVGFPAINPVPRQMILAEADRARRRAGCPDRELVITVSVPEGEALAARTFNPKLGIVGGISVLGTSGIVHPMSEEALIETIRLEIRVRAGEGRRILAVAPGNYGERFLKETMGLSMDSFVKCSNFIGDTFQMMKEEKIEKVLLAGHVGKLIKVAGGVMNTHSRYGDRRMEIMEQCACSVGMPEEQAGKLKAMNTTEEAADYLAETGWLTAVMQEAARHGKEVLEKRFGLETELLLFSMERGLLAETGGAAAFVKELMDVRMQ